MKKTELLEKYSLIGLTDIILSKGFYVFCETTRYEEAHIEYCSPNKELFAGFSKIEVLLDTKGNFKVRYYERSCMDNIVDRTHTLDDYGSYWALTEEELEWHVKKWLEREKKNKHGS